ncbi:MAG: hypothetical protein KC656_08175 [Myxococcales bacterium]|nr:hypothetical protein [Myxococcales bacterium]
MLPALALFGVTPRAHAGLTAEPVAEQAGGSVCVTKDGRYVLVAARSWRFELTRSWTDEELTMDGSLVGFRQGCSQVVLTRDGSTEVRDVATGASVERYGVGDASELGPNGRFVIGRSALIDLETGRVVRLPPGFPGDTYTPVAISEDGAYARSPVDGTLRYVHTATGKRVKKQDLPAVEGHTFVPGTRHDTFAWWEERVTRLTTDRGTLGIEDDSLVLERGNGDEERLRFVGVEHLVPTEDGVLAFNRSDPAMEIPSPTTRLRVVRIPLTGARPWDPAAEQALRDAAAVAEARQEELDRQRRDLATAALHRRRLEAFGDGQGYEGPLVDGLPNGRGRLTYADGTVLEGDFVDGEPHGQASIRHPSGATFRGRMEHGRAVEGRLTQPDGSWWSGGLDGDDRPHGLGEVGAEGQGSLPMKMEHGEPDQRWVGSELLKLAAKTLKEELVASRGGHVELIAVTTYGVKGGRAFHRVQPRGGRVGVVALGLQGQLSSLDLVVEDGTRRALIDCPLSERGRSSIVPDITVGACRAEEIVVHDGSWLELGLAGRVAPSIQDDPTRLVAFLVYWDPSG